MIVYGIDPGLEASGFVELNTESRRVFLALADADHCRVRRLLRDISPADAEPKFIVAIERLQFYGAGMGSDTITTAEETGRYLEALGRAAIRLSRPTIKAHLTGKANTKDAHVRAALLDRFGGEKAARGSKKAQGALYGVHSHSWAALAVAVVAAERELRLAPDYWLP